MRLWRQGASCCRNGLMNQPFKPTAAGNAHAQHGYACNAAVLDDGGQLFDQHFVVLKLGVRALVHAQLRDAVAPADVVRRDAAAREQAEAAERAAAATACMSPPSNRTMI